MDELFANSFPEPNSGCWIWMGSLNESGYGNSRPHRKAYEEEKGEIPEGLFVCHKCDVRSCVNPGHLFIGTHVDNMADMSRKGRATRGKPMQKLTEWEIELIQEAPDYRGVCTDLAARFCVSRSRISQIRQARD